MEDVSQALIIAFSVFVFVIALSLSIYMVSQVTTTAEVLSFYSDSTRYYDNIEYKDNLDEYTERIVSAETIIPTLYRYNKENFCVKIYDDSENLVQIFDLNLENQVNNADADSLAKKNVDDETNRRNYALEQTYNNKDKFENQKGTEEANIYLFGAPWLSSPETIKTRIDYFINGDAGYINNQYVDYRGNNFHEAIVSHSRYIERFISYSYDGQTFQTEEGDTLVTGQSEKDKIVIIYTRLPDN